VTNDKMSLKVVTEYRWQKTGHEVLVKLTTYLEMTYLLEQHSSAG
jgi:hypothetical protein